MASVGTAVSTSRERRTLTVRGRGGIQSQFWWQLATGATVLLYLYSLAFVHRPPSGYLSFWDGWVGNIACTLPIIPIALRARRSSKLRGAWIAMGAGVALNDIGNLVYMLHDQNIHPIPSPALSDIPYLLSYVGFAIGITLMTQRSFGKRSTSIHLDGAIAGLAVASVAAMLWFDSVMQISGNTLQVIVGMSYPLGDIVLLVLLVAGLPPMRFRPNFSTLTLMVGVAWFLYGDVVYLNQAATNTYVPDTLLDGTWLIGIWFMAIAAWPAEDRRAITRIDEKVAPKGILMIPTLFGLLSLAVLARSLDRHTSHVSALLAIAALLLVIVRMVLTLREVSQGALNFRDARTDELTGLGNRRSFLEDSRMKLASLKGSQKVVVLLIDLNDFKEVNDSLGHPCGDDLLDIIGHRLQNALGHRGLIARIGGDEFATACVVTTIDEAVKIAEEITESLDDSVALDGVIVRVGASIGVAVSPDHGTTNHELLRSADVAMYKAKQSYATVCTYFAGDDPNSRDRLAMTDELRAAIDARQLTLHFQPTHDLYTMKVQGVEALARWRHPTRGLLHPDEFIPLAERVGLILPLTRAVLQQAIAEAGRLDREGHELRMSVNISRFDLIDEHLPTFVDGLLEQYQFPAHRLTLEVTESSVGGNVESAKRCIQRFRSSGIRISIDDFGVGYSSMSQLLELPIDELKVDKSFVLALGSDRRARAIVRSAVELARALNLTLVAEGIETPESLRMLQEIGADIGQGYFIARPLTSAQLDDFLAPSTDDVSTEGSVGLTLGA
jgi:diguanylate cyclase (GGDEF)-like protein